MDRLKIFFVMTPAFNPNDGGVQRTTYKLGKYFTNQGLEVVYYSTSKTGHIPIEFGQLFHTPEEGGIQNSNNSTHLKEVLQKCQPTFVINQMPYEVELSNILNENKELLGYILLGCLRNSLFSFKNNARDIIQQIMPPIVFKLFDNPIGIGVSQWRHKKKHSKMLKRIIDQHDRYILLAPPNRNELEYFIGNYKSNKVLAIPNSIPEIYQDNINKEKIILHVGRISIAQKRSDLLLDFWEYVHRELPEWRFVIVGDGPYFDELEEDLKKRNLPRVYLEGYQKPESYFKKASIFMMPSAFEGFPNTILEAQSYGVIPVVFNSYTALNWIVNNIMDTLLIKPYETKSMAKEVIKLANDSDQLNNMKIASLDNASRFTIDKVGKEWLKLFKELLEN